MSTALFSSSRALAKQPVCPRTKREIHSSKHDQEMLVMMIDASELAGLTVIQLVHENSDAIVMYRIDCMDTEEDLNVLIYKMGGHDTEVSDVRHPTVSDAKNQTFEYVEILGETTASATVTILTKLTAQNTSRATSPVSLTKPP